MAIVFLEGFENYGPVNTTGSILVSAMQARWNLVHSDTNHIKIIDGCYGGKGIQMLVDEQITEERNYSIAFEKSNYVVIGMSFYYLPQRQDTTGWPINSWWWALTIAGAIQFEVKITYTGEMYSGSTYLGRLKSTGWHYYEFKVYCNNSGSVEVKVDGVVQCTVNLDTQATSAQTGFNGFSLGVFTGYRYDNIYIATGISQDYLGPIFIESIRPAIDVETDWASTSANHHDAINGDLFDANSYVSSGTANASDNWNCNALDQIDTGIQAIQINAVGKVDSVGVRQLEITCDNGVDEVTSAKVISSFNEDTVKTLLEVDPSSSDWTPTTVNEVVYGVRIGD